MPDSSGKPGEDLCVGPVPDLQRIAGTDVEPGAETDSPKIISCNTFTSTTKCLH